jgi:hypothetical protein
LAIHSSFQRGPEEVERQLLADPHDISTIAEVIELNYERGDMATHI